LGAAEILLSDVTLVDDPRVIKLDGERGELNISIYFVEDSAEGRRRPVSQDCKAALCARRD
jgi:hypothetical protein